MSGEPTLTAPLDGLALPYARSAPTAARAPAAPAPPAAEPLGRVAVTAALVLAALGMLMVYSSSSVRAALLEGDGTFYFKRQLAWGGLGLAALAIGMRTPLGFWRRHARAFFAATVAALVLVLVFGVTLNGARRWFHVGGLSFQPSEAAKLAVLIFCAAWLCDAKDRLQDFRRGCLPAAAALGAVVLLVNREPDFGTALFLGALGTAMLLVGGVRLPHLLLLAVPVIPVLAYSLVARMDVLRARFQIFGGAENAHYQVRQGLVALGSGGFLGRGLGAGKAKLLYLPEGSSDFILPVIGEEMGFAGTLLVVLLYAAFVHAGIGVALRALPRDRFAFLIAFGVTLWVGLQACINIAVVTACAPTKGIALPFVSLGGSGLVVLLAATGMLYAAARAADAAPEPTPAEAAA